jgi:hypothetical protein
MRQKLFALMTLATLLASLLIMPSALAKEPEPPCPVNATQSYPRLPNGELCRTRDGTYYTAAGAAQSEDPSATMSPQATGGPDDFGYTWDDSVALNWIDATGGTHTGLSGSSNGQKTGPIGLPFSFKYYENTYNSLYIAASGYLAFTDEGTWPWQPDVPSPAAPNNLIAPYAAPFDLAASGSINRVYYTSGGTVPNRYFVVEWYQVTFVYDEVYTFEVILHENGDIVFQYQTMSYDDDWACGAIGIEDSTGLDGLDYIDYCDQAPSNRAVRFYRPAPSARVGIRPLYYGKFARAGETASFELPIRNTGELGADTYDLTVYSSGTVSLYDASGAPLSDTDSDGTADSGSIAQGSSKTIFARVETPAFANVGDGSETDIEVCSSLDVAKCKTVNLRAAIPTPFAQVYRDDADGAMSLELVQPDGQTRVKTTPDWHWGYQMAVAEMPNSFAYVWYKSRSAGSFWVGELEYTLRDSAGNAIRGVSKLTNHSGATMNTYDYSPAVAVAPNGRIGVVWYRYLYNSSYESNYNIYYAILDSAGNIVVPPTNLTNNPHWGSG